jgi:hypothetical protein
MPRLLKVSARVLLVVLAAAVQTPMAARQWAALGLVALHMPWAVTAEKLVAAKLVVAQVPLVVMLVQSDLGLGWAMRRLGPVQPVVKLAMLRPWRLALGPVDRKQDRVLKAAPRVVLVVKVLVLEQLVQVLTAAVQVMPVRWGLGLAVWWVWA